MSGERQSQINTVLLGIIVSLSGFVAYQVWNLNAAFSASSVTLTAHSTQLVQIETKVAALQLETARLSFEVEKWKSSNRP